MQAAVDSSCNKNARLMGEGSNYGLCWLQEMDLPLSANAPHPETGSGNMCHRKISLTTERFSFDLRSGWSIFRML